MSSKERAEPDGSLWAGMSTERPAHPETKNMADFWTGNRY